MTGDDRAVSDLVAFTLIFTVMVLSIGVVGIVGFDTIDDVREHEQVNSAQSAMTTVADQMNGIADHEAPVRSAEFRVGGATMSVLEANTSITVRVIDEEEDGGLVEKLNRTIELGALEYYIEDRAVTVMGGAVIRADGDAATMLREPPFLMEDDRGRLNFLTVDSMDLSPSSVTTHRGTQVQSHHRSSRLHHPDVRDGLYNDTYIEIDVAGVLYEDVWASYFEDNGWEDMGSGTYQYGGEDDYLVDGLIVRESGIDIRFIR